MKFDFQKQEQLSAMPLPLSSKEAFSYIQGGAAIVDIRPDYETNYRIFDVPKVYYVPYTSYKDSLSIIPKDILIIVADSVGLRCKEVACYLVSQGYTNVAYLAGGIVEWDHKGLPLKKDLGYELNGGCACRLKSQK